ncbi:MAG: 3-methyl-2-oxobutanoate hydroxymethyltransferase [Butyricicoccus sp.]
MKTTAMTFLQMKQQGRRISELTCYDYSTAKLMEAAGVPAILVGDSLGNTILGYPDTLSVTMEDMIHHSAAVARACSSTMVIMDMPFMSYQTSVYDAVKNAGRLMKEARGQAVKLEGGAAVVPQIRAIVDSGIPVQAHIGMTPQSVNALGGFKVQGKGEAAAKKLLEDAYAVQEAGAFSVVLECTPPKLSALISKKLTIPTIGIGAGAGCDGQVLVYQDMLGMFTDYVPKFVRQFANVGEIMTNAFHDYIHAVEAGAFPTEAHSYIKSDCSDEYLAMLDQTM